MSHFKCKTDSKYTLNKSESGKSLKSTNCRLLDFKPASVSFFSLSASSYCTGKNRWKGGKMTASMHASMTIKCLRREENGNLAGALCLAS